MAFPTDKTEAVDNTTDVLAAHINNLEDKVGIDGSTDTDSLDYQMGAGWIPAGETWTYASATTITVPSGAASKYQKGMPFKLTANSVVLEGYIITVADTLLTVTGDALTNHTFTNNYYAQAGVLPLDFEYAEGIRFRARGSGQSVSAGSWTTVEFDTEDFDIGSNFNTSTHTFTAPLTGYYQISSAVGTSIASGAGRMLHRINGYEIVSAESGLVSGAYDSTNMVQTAYLTKGNELKVEVYFSNAETVSSTRSYFEVHFIGV